MKSLIPLLVLASAVAGAVDIQKRILNGGDCHPDEGRHYVVLTERNGDFDDRFCGGNLISDRWVLTAGHCDEPWFDVILGAHPTRPGTTMHITPGHTRHFFDGNRCHDIMVIQLPQPAPQELTIKLPNVTTAGVTCSSPTPTIANRNTNTYTIIGWSVTAYNASTKTYYNLPANLQCGNVHLDAACTGRNMSVNNPDARHDWVGQHMLCSIEPNACKSCPGDSGGSLVKDGLLYGVTVGSTNPGRGRTLYMDVCAYRDWIHTVTGI